MYRQNISTTYLLLQIYHFMSTFKQESDNCHTCKRQEKFIASQKIYNLKYENRTEF